MPKRILLVHRYYYPDTPAYALMLHRIGKALTECGYEVSVLTSMPSYYGSDASKVKRKEVSDGIYVNRLQLFKEPKRNFVIRTINSILFSIKVFFNILLQTKKYNLITVATTPPLLISKSVCLACRLKRIPFLYHFQDIYPEIAYFSKTLQNYNVYNLLKFLDTRTALRANMSVVLSADMKKTLLDRKININKIAIINNFIRADKLEEIKFDFLEYGIREDSFKIVFCGNIGKLQNLELIMEAFLTILSKYDKIQLIFIGEGIMRKKLERKAQHYLGKEVIFTGYQPMPKVINCLKRCQLGLIPIAEGVHKAAYPSKTMTNLFCGLKSLILVDEDSDMNRFFKDNELGYTASPKDIEQITKTLDYAISEGEASKDESERIKSIADKYFNEKVIMQKWIRVINQIIEKNV